MLAHVRVMIVSQWHSHGEIVCFVEILDFEKHLGSQRHSFDTLSEFRSDDLVPFNRNFFEFYHRQFHIDKIKKLGEKVDLKRFIECIDYMAQVDVCLQKRGLKRRGNLQISTP